MNSNILTLEVLESTEATCDKHGVYKSERRRFAGRKYPFNGCPECARLAVQAADEQAAIADRAAQRARQIERLIRQSGIPPRFQSCSLENFDAPSSEHQAALKVAREYADSFEEHFAAGRCLVLIGKVGTGKTHLATAIAHHIIRHQFRPALYMRVSEAIRTLRATWARDSEDTEREVLKRFQSVDLLILDEVGMTFRSEAEAVQLFEIIDNRYQDMRPTVFISNLDLGTFQEALGDRAFDRLLEGGGKLVPFTWDSHRGAV